MILKIFFLVVLVAVVVLIFAATRPPTIRVQREVLIAASPDTIFPLIDDFHNWPLWAPQDREDPTMTRTYSGASAGAGAVSEWSSRGSAGRGTMSVAQSAPFTRVSVDVRFLKPFAVHNVNDFTLEPAGGYTRVTWSTTADNLYVMKLMSVFANMDKVMGSHFESGLKNLKAIAEQPSTGRTR